MPHFTRDWFSPYIPLWEQLLGGARGAPGLRFVEIGSFEGRSAVWLMENILTHPSSHLDCIDTFEGSFEHDLMGMDLAGLEERFRHNIEPWKDRVGVFRGPSNEILFRPEIRNHKYDFAYVDGCHEAKEVLEDAVLAFSLLKAGGIVIFDDYTWGPADTLPLICPRPAVDVFTSTYALHAEVLHRGDQVVVQKRPTRISAQAYAQKTGSAVPG